MAEPKVRFKRDDGSEYPVWRLVPFKKLSFPTGIRNKNDADLESYSISNEKGFTPQSDQFEDAGYLASADRSLYYIVSPGSFVYNPARINIGSIGYQNVGKDVLVSSLYEIFNTTEDLDDEFLLNWFRTKQFQRNVRRFSEGGVRQYFYYDKLCMVNFPLPCLEEQHKIANFLLSVDDVIYNSEQEAANLEIQKKAVMKKIFSQEVRFKRDDGTEFPEWEEQSFENVFEPLNNNTLSRDMLNYDFGPALNIHYGDILVKYGDVCDVQVYKVPFVNEGINVSKYAHLKDGDIIIADTAEDEAVGKAIEIINVGDLVVVSGLHTMACRPKQKYSPKYLGYYINSTVFHDQLKPYMQGIKVTSIGRKNIKDVSIMYPSSLEEQRLIADFLSDFDEAITAAKKELELWKELKKGLLQQMFV